jgi:MFS family permease
MPLHPQAPIDAETLARGKSALVHDAAWASLTGALSGGVVLVALALELGAGPMTIGVLGAIPFIAQAAQLPAIALVERLRQRKRIAVWTLLVARLLIGLMAVLPLLPLVGARLPLLVLAQAVIALMGSTAGCAINSWLHQLLPPGGLGVFFARRLFWATGTACAGTLAAGLLVQNAPGGNRLLAFGVALGGAGIAGLVSTWYLSRCPEPPMDAGGPPVRVATQLRLPFADRNFRALLQMLAAWNVASNLVAPFLAMYLIQQLGYPLATVTALWVTSQVANAATLLAWGRVSDRRSNTSILRVALPLYFACTLGLVFVPAGERDALQLGVLVLLHLLMGAAGGGVGLATGNLGLKLAPRARGTAYLAAIGLVGAVCGGLAPLVGGALAQMLSDRELSLLVRWVSPGGARDVSVLSFAHWEFLFVLSALLGLYVLHAATRIDEGDALTRPSDREVIQELALETWRTLNQVSTIGGLLGGLFSFERLSERRRLARGPRPGAPP